MEFARNNGAIGEFDEASVSVSHKMDGADRLLILVNIDKRKSRISK